MNYDTIVIGAGLAGLTAAIGRAERGERVMLLAKGHGTTHWATGCLDLIESQTVPADALRSLRAERPDHPYALAGHANLATGIARVRAACEAAGYPMVGGLEHTLWLPTALGALRPTALIPATMAAGELRQLADGRPTLIAGLPELRDFFPPLIAANLRAQNLPADGVYLDLPPVDRAREFNPPVFARLFERPAFRAAIGDQLAGLVRRGKYARVGLPAVLGLYQATDVVRDLQTRCGALIFEIPTLPTSVPGMRLYHALEQAALRAGVRIQLGSWVQHAEAQADHLVAVFSEAAAREQRHTAKRWVLATGGIIGGGLRAVHTGELRETALGLPVRAPSGRADWFAQRFLDEAGHPVFGSGLVTDAQLRPLDAAGRVVYQNVVVAGSALAGFDPIREGCLEGAAIATGYTAGQL
ncbi:MAG: glycerol-3-phosphate dehydrogenase subunit GlpB [Oscillochloridaceae bacterium umkhey_bin13]